MIDETPLWTFLAQSRSCCFWYDHVRLLPDHVLGGWFYLDRNEGRVIWEESFWRIDTIRAITSNMIIASETRSDGPWTFDFGCYGISLQTGELRWRSHGSGWKGRLLHWADFVPCFTNEWRDRPHHVIGNEVFCCSGRVLDAETGAQLRRISRDDVLSYGEPPPFAHDDAHLLYQGSIENSSAEVRVGSDMRLMHEKRDANTLRDFRLCMLRDDGATRWRFDLKSTGYQIDGNYFSYRYRYPFVYLVVSEGPQTVPVWRDPLNVRANAVLYRLLTLDVIEGRIIDDFLVDDRKLTHCRIEDMDDRGLLISVGPRGLKYFRRSPK